MKEKEKREGRFGRSLRVEDGSDSGRGELEFLEFAKDVLDICCCPDRGNMEEEDD